MKFRIFLCSICALLFLPFGCKTLSNEQVVANRVGRLAAIATPLVLKAKPEWRQGFSIAQIALEELSRDTDASFDDLLAIVARLPVDELQSDEAKLYIAAGAEATLLLLDLTLGSYAIDLTKAGSVQPIAAALARGLGTGLAVNVAKIPDSDPLYQFTRLRIERQIAAAAQSPRADQVRSENEPHL